MINGLVLGKFMPLHKGHLALAEFALRHCDRLTVLLCHHAGEPIAASQRMLWLQTIFAGNAAVNLLCLEYNPAELTETSDADPGYAKAWAETLVPLLPSIDVFFSSEAYGDAFAARLGARHRVFDEARRSVPVSASLIRQKPLTHWDYLPTAVQPFFVKKIALLGSESTGKSILAERLADRYQTCFVPEMARRIIGHTNDCTEEALLRIAALHAQETVRQTTKANRLLFLDTDLLITQSYSLFLFAKELTVPPWIEEANNCSLYLFLDTGCPYVQDGTRLSGPERKALGKIHLRTLKKSSVPYKIISGNWEQRFNRACRQIEAFTTAL